MTNLKELYKEEFSGSMFKHDEAAWSEYQIVGKHCVISLEGTDDEPILDIWLTPKSKTMEGHGTKKLNNMISMWQGELDAQWTKLDGEAYIKTKNMKSIIDNRVLLGLKKKPYQSPEKLADLKSRRFPSI